MKIGRFWSVGIGSGLFIRKTPQNSLQKEGNTDVKRGTRAILPRNLTPTPGVLCAQLERLKVAYQKRPPRVYKANIIFRHDNSRAHGLTIIVRWATVGPTPYLSNLPLSDFHLFGSLDHNLKGKEVYSEGAICKSSKFYKKGILLVANRWRCNKPRRKICIRLKNRNTFSPNISRRYFFSNF